MLSYIPIDKCILDNPNEKEAWICINNEKTRYIVRTDGRIFSTNYRMSGKIHELSKVTDTGGYQEVKLSIHNKSFLAQVHQLVAQAFILNSNNYDEVNHIDGNKKNNHVENLEWSSRSDNLKHAYANNLIKPICGENHSKTNLSNKTVRKICELIEDNVGLKTISKITGVPYLIVNSIYHKRTWNSISKDYNFDNFTANEHRKLSNEDVRRMCELYINNPDLNFSDIGRIFNMHKTSVRNILRGNAYKEIVCQYDLDR